MRTLIVPILALAAVAFVAVAFAGCGRSDRDQLGHDVHAVANDLKADVRKVGDNADLKRAGAEIKHTAAQAGAAIKSTAHDAANGARRAGDDAKHAAHRS